MDFDDTEIFYVLGSSVLIDDMNNDGINEICFVKDKKSGTVHMTLNCYNHSGDLLLDSKLSPTTDTVKTAIVADMNNDGKKDIITENNIYTLNGTSIFSYDLGSNFVIPVDVDNNNRLDLIWTKQGATKLFIDDGGTVKVSSVLIKPEAPSVEDSLSCQWKVDGNNKLISANVSWYKNNEFYSSENAACINATLCLINNNIPSSALKENDVWKGDYDEDEVKDIAGFYTPTPGGIGPLDIAYLMHNLVESTRVQK